ncbi:hypothetical protein PIB30_015562 [Stylosanthes scabra]|uniref:Uncharacterized protein n=1 Tax=Stylosanthes scabra TaxID=79078 RepID=A0ABU6Q6X5_9FABA|nr:hypothetical protein [Stylosanthes scabra]
MDYTTWPEFQHNQTLNPTLPSSSSFYSYSYPPLPSSSSYTPNFTPYPQNPNPSSSIPPNTVLEPVVNPPGVDSYAPPLPLPTTQVVGGYEQVLPQNYSYTQTQIVGHDPNSLVASSGYYYDPNAQNWGDTAREAVRQYGSDPLAYGDVISMGSNGTEQLAIANTNPAAWWTNTATQVQAQVQSQAQPLGNNKWKQLPKKKPKTMNVQPAYCEVCKIDCTSKEVLDQHKLGKKHKKNVEKLRELLRPPHPQASNPVIGLQLWNKSKRKSIETPEDLEKKKKKVLEGGAAAEAVKVCSICNVVCNSETVYNFHLAGQKHAAMVKKAYEKIQSNAK